MALRPRVPPILEDDCSEFLVLSLLVRGPLLLLLAICSSLLEVLIIWRLKLVDVLPTVGLDYASVDVGVLINDELASLLV